MSDVAVWHLYAYFHADEHGERDEHRWVAEWQIDDVVRWARHRGYDAIVLTRTSKTARFEKAAAPAGIRHQG